MKKSFAFAVLLLLTTLTVSAHQPSNVALQGFLDVVDCHAIAGWAADTSRLNTSITVKLFTDGVFSRSLVASNSRSDVATALGDNGLHGFSFQIPISTMDNQPHSIKVTFEDGVTELTNSPRSLTCAPPSLVAVGSGQPTGLQITSFDVRPRFATLKVINQNTTDPTLRVTAEFDHTPAFFRLGEVRDVNNPEQDLRNLPWKSYTEGMLLTFRLDTTRPYGVRNVFMQINNQQSENGASRPKGDSITFAPTSTKEFVLTGAELSGFISRARSLGYRFSLSGPSIVGNYPCNSGLRVQDYNTLEAAVTDTSRNFTESWSGEIFKKGGAESFLNQFWTVREINMGEIFPSTPTRTTNVTGPISGRQDDLSRAINWKASFAYFRSNATITCVFSEGTFFTDPPIKSITLQGPSDKPATDAFRTPN